jgi:hypothetical protein
MLGKGYLCAVVTQEAANWPTPDASNHRDGAVLRTDNNLEQGGFHGVSLHHAMTKYGQAAPANPSTDGSRRGLWPTPNSQPVQRKLINGKNQSTKTGQIYGTSIAQAVQQWQTATVSTGANRQKDGSMTDLGNQVAQLGTPTARDHKSGRGNQEREYKELTPMVERTQTGKLNPRWVETLMGLPVGWVMPSCASPVTIEPTNCDSSATESCLPQPSELFEFFGTK